jgi:hypothetical protein
VRGLGPEQTDPERLRRWGRLAIGRQERMSLIALAGTTLLNALFGAAIVLLKVFVH